MTYEEIEQALERCALMTRDGCNGCPMELKKDEFYSCTIEVSEQALDYIKRLKEKNKAKDEFNEALLKQLGEYFMAKDFMKVAKTSEKIERIKEYTRKETAKELLQILFDEAMRYGKSTDGIQWMAQKYGVKLEVEE